MLYPSIMSSKMEKQRMMDVQYTQTSVCVKGTDEGNCPLQPLIDRLNLSTDSFIALTLSEDLHVFKVTSLSMNEEGKFNQGDLSIKCRFMPERKLGFECGELMFRIFATTDILPSKH